MGPGPVPAELGRQGAVARAALSPSMCAVLEGVMADAEVSGEQSAPWGGRAPSQRKTVGSTRRACLAHARGITPKLRGKQVLKYFAGARPSGVQPAAWSQPLHVMLPVLPMWGLCLADTERTRTGTTGQGQHGSCCRPTKSTRSSAARQPAGGSRRSGGNGQQSCFGMLHSGSGE